MVSGNVVSRNPAKGIPGPKPTRKMCIRDRYMTEKDVELLNNYHKEVYEKISPYLEGDEKEWLKEATRPISK